LSKTQISGRYLTSRIGPSIWLALLPLPTGAVAILVSLATGRDFGYPEATIGVFGVWLLALMGTVGQLKRHWVGAAQQPTWSLFAAGFVAVLCWGALMEVGAPWQDLMSLPKPTPAMVLMDVLANFGPLIASAISAWVLLLVTGRGEASRA